ncbi:hypothetical protein KW787_03290 [Candidatus Pacearchaeota archaeon]|nr:hypothetical protein [Candidatus Pacearchaeota archaeon]
MKQIEKNPIIYEVLQGRFQRLHENAVSVMSNHLEVKVYPVPVKIDPDLICDGSYDPESPEILISHYFTLDEYRNSYSPPLSLVQCIRRKEFTCLHETGHHFQCSRGCAEEQERWKYLQTRVYQGWKERKEILTPEENEERERLWTTNEVGADIFAFTYLELVKGPEYFSNFVAMNRFLDLDDNPTHRWQISTTGIFSPYRKMGDKKRKLEILRTCMTERSENIFKIPELARYFRYIESLSNKEFK